MTRRQMLTALFGAAVLALPVAGCGHQPVQDEQGAELILRYAENQPEDYPTTQAALAFADLVAPAHRWPRESAGVQRGRTGRGAERDPADAVRRH